MAPNFEVDSSLLKLILDNKIDRALFTDILHSYGVKNQDEIKDHLIDVFLDHVEDIVDDHKITETEISGAKKIKRLFKIKEGDLYGLKKIKSKSLYINK